MNILRGSTFPRGIYSEVHSPITTPEIICVMALTLQPMRGCPQHSGETGTRLSSAIHRRLLSRFFLREGGRLYTGYVVRENNLKQNISWFCWPFVSAVKLLHPLPFKNSRSHKNCDFDSETFGLPIPLWS